MKKKNVIPEIIAATGNILKLFSELINNITGKRDIRTTKKSYCALHTYFENTNVKVTTM
jgi:hypothetical protein